MSLTLDTPLQSAFLLKATSLTSTVLQLTTVRLEAIEQQLGVITEQTPHFFNATPVILDTTQLSDTDELELDRLLASLKNHDMLPIGIIAPQDALIEKAKQIGLPLIPNTTFKQPKKATHESALKTARIVYEPIRSGSQLYAKNQDLIIMSTVGNGAEVMADGNIHVYGAIRGRVMAGVSGLQDARIFCNDLDAELVAIAGNYLVNEQIPSNYKRTNALIEISLVAESLRFNKIHT